MVTPESQQSICSFQKSNSIGIMWHEKGHFLFPHEFVTSLFIKADPHLRTSHSINSFHFFSFLFSHISVFWGINHNEVKQLICSVQSTLTTMCIIISKTKIRYKVLYLFYSAKFPCSCFSYRQYFVAFLIFILTDQTSLDIFSRLGRQYFRFCRMFMFFIFTF